MQIRALYRKSEQRLLVSIWEPMEGTDSRSLVDIVYAEGDDHTCNLTACLIALQEHGHDLDAMETLGLEDDFSTLRDQLLNNLEFED